MLYSIKFNFPFGSRYLLYPITRRLCNTFLSLFFFTIFFISIFIMTRALIAMSNDEFKLGIELFDKLLSLDEHQIDAVSNRALCLLYDHKLMQAIGVFFPSFSILKNIAILLSIFLTSQDLEKFLEKTPEKHVHETIIFNLCTLYDLAWSDGITRKEELLAKVHSYLPDDFDFDVFKIPVTD